MKFLFPIAIILLYSCHNQKEDEIYKIYNTVLEEKVSTYGIMASYLPYNKNYSEKELDGFAKKISDSLSKSQSLTYYLEKKLTILDTLHPSDEFYSGRDQDLVITFKPKYSNKTINFSKIKKLEIGNRIEKEKKIDESEKFPTYLGSYDLSEPIFISENNAVLRFQHQCGSKCGIGILIYLKKQNNQWKIVKEKEIWIS